MGCGMSDEARRGGVVFLAPRSIIDTVHDPLPDPANRPAGAGRQFPLSKGLSAAIVVFLIFYGIGTTLPNIAVLLWPNLKNQDGPVNLAITVTPPIVPTVVVSVASKCPAGCVAPWTASSPAVVQPGVVILMDPIEHRERLVGAVPQESFSRWHSDGRYEPIMYDGSTCPTLSIYLVRPGDTIYQVARWFGVDPHAIVEANGLFNPNYIQAGQVLSIPCAPAHWYGYP